MALRAGQAVLVQCVQIGVRVELFHGVDALGGPLAGQQHQCAAHGRNAGGIADGLRADFLVALLVVADIVNVVGLFLAVLFAGEDAADVGLALGAGAEAGGIRQEGFQELDGDDLLPVEVDGGGGEHPHVLEAAHVVEIALAEGHEEADALCLRDVLCQRLDLLVVEQVHILLAHLVEIVLPLDAHVR